MPYGLAARQRAIAEFSVHDAERLPAYDAALERAAAVLRKLVLEDASQCRRRPHGAGSRALRSRARILKLPIEDQCLVVDLFTKSASDFLAHWFENETVKAGFAFDGIVGSYASAVDAGHGLRAAASLLRGGERQAGVWGHALGGMGAITQAMAKAARSRGAEIRVGVPGGAR